MNRKIDTHTGTDDTEGHGYRGPSDAKDLTDTASGADTEGNGIRSGRIEDADTEGNGIRSGRIEDADTEGNGIRSGRIEDADTEGNAARYRG